MFACKGVMILFQKICLGSFRWSFLQLHWQPYLKQLDFLICFWRHGAWKIVAQGTSSLGELPAVFPLTTAVPQETITCIVEHVYFTGWTSVVFYGPGVLNIKLY